MSTWWERWPERLKYEEDALDTVGIPWSRNEDAFRHGILELNVRPTVDGEKIDLAVRFADLYPYFRFEVRAAGLRLAYHQNPIEHNLCLLGRRTHFWDTTDTVAGLLQTQLPRLLKAARSDDVEVARGVEQEQAEPVTDYYPYGPGMIMLEGAWPVERQHGQGRLVIGTPGDPKRTPAKLVRGVVLEVRSKEDVTLWQASQEFGRCWGEGKLSGLWFRLPEPIMTGNPGDFLENVKRKHPSIINAAANRVADGWLQIWGFVFPEETGWRRMGDGCVFVCGYHKQRPGAPSTRNALRRFHGKKGKKGKRRH